MAGKYKIVMVRHGESEWNQKNLFCGWFDANLSDKGMNFSVVVSKMQFNDIGAYIIKLRDWIISNWFDVKSVMFVGVNHTKVRKIYINYFLN